MGANKRAQALTRKSKNKAWGFIVSMPHQAKQRIEGNLKNKQTETGTPWGMISDLLTALPVSFRAQTTARVSHGSSLTGCGRVAHLGLPLPCPVIQNNRNQYRFTLPRACLVLQKRPSVTQTISYYTQQQPGDAGKWLEVASPYGPRWHILQPKIYELLPAIWKRNDLESGRLNKIPLGSRVGVGSVCAHLNICYCVFAASST